MFFSKKLYIFKKTTRFSKKNPKKTQVFFQKNLKKKKKLLQFFLYIYSFLEKNPLGFWFFFVENPGFKNTLRVGLKPYFEPWLKKSIEQKKSTQNPPKNCGNICKKTLPLGQPVRGSQGVPGPFWVPLSESRFWVPLKGLLQK